MAFAFKKKYTNIPNISFTGTSLNKARNYLIGIESVLNELDVYYERTISILNIFRQSGRMSSAQLMLLGCFLADNNIDIMSDLINPIMNQRDPVYRYKNVGGWLEVPAMFKTSQPKTADSTVLIPTEVKKSKGLEDKSNQELVKIIRLASEELSRRGV